MRHIPSEAETIQTLIERERERFFAAHPRSVALAEETEAHFLMGVPLHWMQDWPSPSPLFIRHASGATLECADGRQYCDFCLGDTAAMFGHSPLPLAQALATQAAQGLSFMLPSEDTASVGQLLSQRFGLPMWQLAMTASDANRFVLRWARAVTQRQQVLVFDGCYHGAVDDTLVDLIDGQVVSRPSLLGSAQDHSDSTRVIAFNDLQALEQALSDGQVACLLAEPALTNCGLVLPSPGFWEAAQALCQRHGTLLVLDETHTLSTAPGGYARLHGLAPDMLVIGKAVAGGLPCAVYGFTRELAERMREAKRTAVPGHSGIGTTLSGNALALAALQAALQHLHTEAGYQAMQARADELEQGLQALLQRYAQPWTVTRLGARLELQFMARAPGHAADVRAHQRDDLETLVHLYLLNHGVVLTPFHCMMLLCPATTSADVQRLLEALGDLLRELQAAERLRLQA